MRFSATFWQSFVSFLKSNYEFTALQAVEFLVGLGASPHTARSYLAVARSLDLVVVRVRRRQNPIYRSRLFEADEAEAVEQARREAEEVFSRMG